MVESAICQRCGAGVGPDGAQGLCPACLLEQGLRDSQAPTLPAGAAAEPGVDQAELSRLFPQLEILGLEGRGGMGVVYKARHRGLDRLVALKILPPGIDRDPGFQERFVREARALARLNHPNIVAVYDFGQAEGRYYFLMEFVDGANLRRMLQAGHLTAQQAMAIVPQLCDALQFAHEEGIVHRDIKPENILLDRKGRVKIADFGLAKLLNGSVQQDSYTLTSPRQVLGTPHYMAPEQLERPGSVDHRADIFSLGVVFYEMLTGELPLGRFAAPSRKVQIDVRLDEVVLRTLEKEPEHRYQRAGEVKTELASLATTPPALPQRWSAAGAGDAGVGGPREPAPSWRPSLSPTAIIGVILAFPFPLACLITAFYASQDGPTGGSAGDFIVSTLAILGVSSAVSSCALGLSAIRQIRRSPERYCGLKLALAAAMAYPLLLLDLIVFSMTMFALAPHNEADGNRIALLMCAVLIALDVWIIRRAWRRVSRPPQVRPDQHQPAQRPTRPPVTSSRLYSLEPKRGLSAVLIGFGAAFILVLGLLVLVWARLTFRQREAAVRERQAVMEERQVVEAANQAVIRPDGPGVANQFCFVIHTPADMKTSVWAELWKNGKLQTAPPFGIEHWFVPPSGLRFDGRTTFEMEPRQGVIMVGWRSSGNAGGQVSEQPMADPFAGMTLRDATWSNEAAATPGSREWRLSPGRPQQILVLRGANQRLIGSPELAPVGQADVEVRLFVRVDPLTLAEQGSQPMIGSSPHPQDQGPGIGPDGADTTPQGEPPRGLPASGGPAPLVPATPSDSVPTGAAPSTRPENSSGTLPATPSDTTGGAP